MAGWCARATDALARSRATASYYSFKDGAENAVWTTRPVHEMLAIRGAARVLPGQGRDQSALIELAGSSLRVRCTFGFAILVLSSVALAQQALPDLGFQRRMQTLAAKSYPFGAEIVGFQFLLNRIDHVSTQGLQSH